MNSNALDLLQDSKLAKSSVFQEGQGSVVTDPVSGRGVFVVRTLGPVISIESAFLVESGEVLRLPGVFPSLEYAMAQIDELRDIVKHHFDEISKISDDSK